MVSFLYIREKRPMQCEDTLVMTEKKNFATTLSLCFPMLTLVVCDPLFSPSALILVLPVLFKVEVSVS